MYYCDICNKEFPTYHGVKGHKRVHNEFGGKRVVARPITAKTRDYNCLYCGKPSTCRQKARNIYCSGKCHHSHRWETVNRPRVIAGNGDVVTIKRYLVEEYGCKCKNCGISDWQGRLLSLELDHIDGNSDNNNIDNVRLLCPNCHSQTDTYTGRNKKNAKRNQYQQKYKSVMIKSSMVGTGGIEPP